MIKKEAAIAPYKILKNELENVLRKDKNEK